MKYFNVKYVLPFCMLSLSALFGCKGKTGPQGSQGPEGLQGPQGTVGSTALTGVITLSTCSSSAGQTWAITGLPTDVVCQVTGFDSNTNHTVYNGTGTSGTGNVTCSDTTPADGVIYQATCWNASGLWFGSASCGCTT